MKVSVVSLGEGGNLGDDLILIRTMRSCLGVGEEVRRLTFLSFGQQLPIELIMSTIGVDVPVEGIHRVNAPRGYALTSRSTSELRRADVVIFGGGGLLQDSHHPERPFQWLRHLPRRGVFVAALGLGVGPLAEYSLSSLRRGRSPFALCEVRDEDSAALMDAVDWPSTVSGDMVDRDLVDRLASGAHATDSRPVLGVAVRSWPGLSSQTVADQVMRLLSQHAISAVTLFVLEALDGVGPDVSFSEEVQVLLREEQIVADLLIYKPTEILDFLSAMAGCRVALSMKLHSSVIWGFAGVPIYPIVYAPKVASFFGVPYRGLEILEQSVEPSENWAVISDDSFRRMFAEAKKGARPRGSVGLTSATRVRSLARSLMYDLRRKARLLK